MKCLWCGNQIKEELTLKQLLSWQKIEASHCCQRCHSLFTKIIRRSACPFCGKGEQKRSCQECQMWQVAYGDIFNGNESLFYYDQGMKEWFQKYKFQGDQRLAQMFRQELQYFFKDKPGALIIPVPLSPKRLAKRGFNQVEMLLAAGEIPFEKLLLKKSETVEQTTKNREERLQTAQPFCLAQGGKQLIHNRKVILVDDVYTTGRTIFHGVACLKEAVPLSITSVTLAR